MPLLCFPLSRFLLRYTDSSTYCHSHFGVREGSRGISPANAARLLTSKVAALLKLLSLVLVQSDGRNPILVKLV
jgi:hypothetical protein